jgi:hypothetical protein
LRPIPLALERGSSDGGLPWLTEPAFVRHHADFAKRLLCQHDPVGFGVIPRLSEHVRNSRFP